MRNATIISICILVILSALFSCTKKRPYRNVNAELKAKYSFKPGSYWVYLDSLSGDVDSFYVRQYDVRTEKAETYDYEYISTIIQAFKSRQTEDNIVAMQLNENSIGFQYYTTSRIGLGYGFGIPFPFSNVTYNNYSIEIFDSYHLINNDYNNTAMIIFKDYRDIYYLSDDAGIIKMSIMDDVNRHRVWKLLRWHIEH